MGDTSDPGARFRDQQTQSLQCPIVWSSRMHHVSPSSSVSKIQLPVWCINLANPTISHQYFMTYTGFQCRSGLFVRSNDDFPSTARHSAGVYLRLGEALCACKKAAVSERQLRPTSCAYLQIRILVGDGHFAYTAPSP